VVFLVLVVTRRILSVREHAKTKNEESRMTENNLTVSSVLEVIWAAGTDCPSSGGPALATPG
jgi:hypothetical protein